MNVAVKPETKSIVVDEVFPHAPEAIWKVLTTGALIGRWLMAPTGFAPVKGTRFTYKTKPAGAWDGTIQCEVLEVTGGGGARRLLNTLARRFPAAGSPDERLDAVRRGT